MLDDVAPKAVVVGQRDTADGRQLIPRDRLSPGQFTRLILHVALWQAADGGCAQADQRRGAVGGVPLEIAAHLARGERIIRKGEVVEPDRDIPLRPQAPGSGKALVQAIGGAGKLGFGEKLLVRLHPGHMSIAEQGDPLWT